MDMKVVDASIHDDAKDACSSFNQDATKGAFVGGREDRENSKM
jgi:hypothetical protein